MWSYRYGPPCNDFLIHYGISGQRWGLRRFQNEDGTLTEEGKKRYGTKENFEKQQESEQAKKEFDTAKRVNRTRIFDSVEKMQEKSRAIADKEYKYRKALYESLHSQINTKEISESERNKASKLLESLYNKQYKGWKDKLSKDMPGYEYNFDKYGNPVGISRIGEKNMDLFFKLDPSLTAVYDRSGRLIQKKK